MMDSQPNKDSTATDVPAPEPPRILDRMLKDIKTSVDEQMAAVGIPRPAPEPAPPRKVVSLPTNQLEPAPAEVFVPPEKPPKSVLKRQMAGEPPKDAPAATPLPVAPPTTSEQQATPAMGVPWVTLGITTLLLLNVTLIATLLAFLFGVFPRDQDASSSREVATHSPPTILEAPDPEEQILLPIVPDAPASTSEAVFAQQESAPDPLQIAKLVLTRGVTGFALYDPIPDIPLLPRHVNYMYVYTEIDHPKPESREDGRFIYNLTKNVRLYRADIGPTEPLMNTTISLVERGLSPRRDFYARQRLQSARRIEPGEHVLEVRISDRNSGESVTQQLSFIIHPN